MAEADVNENEWNESGKATQPENQLRRMWWDAFCLKWKLEIELPIKLNLEIKLSIKLNLELNPFD